ncbi:hypothetical protein FKW77_005393 [Venturia effusa]|uniref:Uncharacterized protein n=1 Tax=Venturia effusa TaxID=50376 RepID=A0A517KWE7_9PEZI|nr:hypothetical protein FKW77_005393 [Venturia effusa]
MPSTPSRRGKGKKDANESPNADCGLELLESYSDHSIKTQALDLNLDTAIRFEGFKARYPKKDFDLTPGEFPVL